jgi:uncharacterized membrane protein
MTHGDKTKAKAGKTSQASAQKNSSSKAGGENGKGSGSKEPSAAKAGAESGSKPKGRAAAGGNEPGGFGNPVIADAFKHALKKYPNALRKLTD